MSSFSKPLASSDESAADFVREILAGDPTFGINFDRVQWDSKQNCYVIVEFLLCEESQGARGITPHSSHPNRYFHKNAQKFISLWELAQKLGAKLYLVNYAKKGTQYEDQILFMNVERVDPNLSPPVQTKDKELTRAEFAKSFRELNQRGRR